MVTLLGQVDVEHLPRREARSAVNDPAVEQDITRFSRFALGGKAWPVGTVSCPRDTMGFILTP